MIKSLIGGGAKVRPKSGQKLFWPFFFLPAKPVLDRAAAATDTKAVPRKSGDAAAVAGLKDSAAFFQLIIVLGAKPAESPLSATKMATAQAAEEFL